MLWYAPCLSWLMAPVRGMVVRDCVWAGCRAHVSSCSSASWQLCTRAPTKMTSPVRSKTFSPSCERACERFGAGYVAWCGNDGKRDPKYFRSGAHVSLRVSARCLTRCLLTQKGRYGCQMLSCNASVCISYYMVDVVRGLVLDLDITYAYLARCGTALPC